MIQRFRDLVFRPACFDSLNTPRFDLGMGDRMAKKSNQYTGGARRPERLPIIPVTNQEHDLVEEYCALHHLSYAQAVRSGLVVLGALKVESLHDLHRDYLATVLNLMQARK